MRTHALRPSQILVLCRGDKEVVAGMGQTATISEARSFASEDPLWEIRVARLLMPVEVPLLQPGEEGLSLHMATAGGALGELVADGLLLSSYGDGFTVDGHGTVIYELIVFLTKTKPAILKLELA